MGTTRKPRSTLFETYDRFALPLLVICRRLALLLYTSFSERAAMKLWTRLLCFCRRRSPWIFHMNSGSCNGCDIELIAALTPRYDAEQLGVLLQGSPRHADILCVTGPVTQVAAPAIHTVYEQVCGPKAVVAIGSCPASTNVFIDSRVIVGPLDKHVPVDVYVPGCPPRPDAIVRGIAAAANLLASRREQSDSVAPSATPEEVRP
jgi:membrane-bound hydrogenase subunit mbhJ